MDAEIKKNANTKFYVASDDDEVKEMFEIKISRPHHYFDG